MSQESHDDLPKAGSSNFPLPGTTLNKRLSLLQWLLVAVFVMTVLTLIWAHSPARIRLIGLFSLAFGLAAGWILGATSRFLERPVSRNVVLLSFVLIALGETGWTLELYRIYVGQLRLAYEQDVPQLIAPELFKQQDNEGDESVNVPQRMKAAETLGESIQEARREELKKRIGFSVYLQHRITPFVQWPTPFPELFWGCEVLLGSLAGAWITRHAVRSAQRLDDGAPLR
ncbi:MAG: hypothetical protein IID46_02935 [Planctomycetes bacterium]|nr:hypothetical protein [Planctomycetota bacterium]